VTVKEREGPAAVALRRARLEPLELAAKEGLALINGTHLMAAQLALLRVTWTRVLPAALIAFAMSLDACRASDAYLDPRVYRARNQSGADAVAAELRRLIRGSRIVRSHLENDPRVQDPYSFRCAPIVLGAVVDHAAGAWRALDQELGAVTDNPLVLPAARTGHPPDIVSAGNFHGMPLALPLDALAISFCHLAGIAERRVYHMISAFDPESHLRPFLTMQPGLNSGLMIAQYTAAAACNELIGLATPASVANLSTCAGMEDYNSFGPRAAAKAVRSLQLVTTVVAIELLCAAQGLEYHRPLRSSPVVEQAHQLIRRRVKKLGADRPLAPDIAALESMISAGRLRPAGPAAGLNPPSRRAPPPPPSFHLMTSSSHPIASGPRVVRAPRGRRRSCRNWITEAALRMLMNNLDPAVAEHPETLVVYGGRGQAARDWPSFDAIVASLRALAEDETLLVQSGKPVGVVRTHVDAPRVLIANSNLVPHWATQEHFDALVRKGLMMFGQMTAGSWIYIGTQGILQGTYETFAEAGRQHFGGTLAGRWCVTGGCGGMGGAQPLAVTMAEGVCLIADVDRSRLRKRVADRYLDEIAPGSGCRDRPGGALGGGAAGPQRGRGGQRGRRPAPAARAPADARPADGPDERA
jgi:hypothetical protein